MKKITLIFSTALFAVASLLTSCSTPSEKVDVAQDNVEQAKEDLRKANEAYLADIEAQRTETNNRIDANRQSIADFKERIKDAKKEAKDDYNSKIEALEHKNTDMKRRFDEYKADGKTGWEIFKKEFKHDMDVLGQAFKDLTVNNVK